jgi:hypothetical protein
MRWTQQITQSGAVAHILPCLLGIPRKRWGVTISCDRVVPSEACERELRH